MSDDPSLTLRFVTPSETNADLEMCTPDNTAYPRRVVARYQRPTALLTDRHRSKSPTVRSKSRQPDSGSKCERYDYETLQREIVKRNGVLTFHGEVIHATMEDFVAEGCLGAGTCSTVFKMRHRCRRDLIMAVKQMRISSTYEEKNKRIMMDLDVVTKSYDCAHIVECYGIFFTASDVWICMEVMCTSLDKILYDLHRPFPEKVIGKVTVAIITALHYLKSKHNVMHRDVKPSNMLLGYQGVIKLCDFGISGKLKDSIAQSRQLGCTGYTAPERINNATYDVRADIWSLGISLLELATGTFPYTGTDIEFAIMTKIIRDPAPSLPHHIPFTPAFRHFIDLCLIKNHTERPKYNPLMSTEFFMRYDKEPYDVLEWLKTLPLSYLHYSDDTDPSVDLNCSTPTPSSIQIVNNSPSSPDSVLTLSPNISIGLSNTSLDDSGDWKRSEDVPKRAHEGMDITLVAAPTVNTNHCSKTKCNSGNSYKISDSKNKSFIIENISDTIDSCQIDTNLIKQQHATTVSDSIFNNTITTFATTITANPSVSYCNNVVTVTSAVSGDENVPINYIHAHDNFTKSVKLLSQASSGYGSAGSDSSPGSLGGSDSRPSSATQLPDLAVPNRVANGVLVLPSLLSKQSKSDANDILEINELNAFTDRSQNSLENNTLKQYTITPVGSDQWSISSLSLRTTHVPIPQTQTQPSTNNSFVNLLQKFESDIPIRESSQKILDTNSNRSGKFPDVPDRLTSRQIIQNRQLNVDQARSASVGAQLQRTPAQKWSVKPYVRKTSNQNFTNTSPGHTTNQVAVSSRWPNNPTSMITAAPVPPSPSNTQLLPNTSIHNISPQQYHHHYYYYYYENPHEMKGIGGTARAMTPPLSSNICHLLANTQIGANNLVKNIIPHHNSDIPLQSSISNQNLVSHTPDTPLSGRLSQRLNTHPIPRQLSTHVGLTHTNLRYPKLGSKLIHNPDNHNLCLSNISSLSPCQFNVNGGCTVNNSYNNKNGTNNGETVNTTINMVSTSSIQNNSSRSQNSPNFSNSLHTVCDNRNPKRKQLQQSNHNHHTRSSSQPPKSRDWCSFETEL